MRQPVEKWEIEYEKKFGIKGTLVFNSSDVFNLLCSAFNGGSTYWAEIPEKSWKVIDKATKEFKKGDLCFEERILIAIQRGATVEILDKEDEKLYPITSESWAKAERLMMEKHSRHFADALNDGDATTGDVFFQLAVLGDVIYG
jgi:hypothetical protein